MSNLLFIASSPWASRVYILSVSAALLLLANPVFIGGSPALAAPPQLAASSANNIEGAQLTEAERRTLLKDEFHAVSSVHGVPPTVAKLLDLNSAENGMADPGQPWSAGCCPMPGAGSFHRRMLFSALNASRSRFFIAYELGGIAHYFRLDLYELKSGSATLLWRKDGIKSYGSFDEFKSALAADKVD